MFDKKPTEPKQTYKMVYDGHGKKHRVPIYENTGKVPMDYLAEKNTQRGKAGTQDKKRVSKTVYPASPEPHLARQWMKDPGRSDIQGIDAPWDAKVSYEPVKEYGPKSKAKPKTTGTKAKTTGTKTRSTAKSKAPAKAKAEPKAKARTVVKNNNEKSRTVEVTPGVYPYTSNKGWNGIDLILIPKSIWKELVEKGDYASEPQTTINGDRLGRTIVMLDHLHNTTCLTPNMRVISDEEYNRAFPSCAVKPKEKPKAEPKPKTRSKAKVKPTTDPAIDDIKGWMRINPKKYIDENKGFIPVSDLAILVELYEHGATQHQRVWIEDVLTGCNFNDLASSLRKGDYVKAKEILGDEYGGVARSEPKTRAKKKPKSITYKERVDLTEPIEKLLNRRDVLIYETLNGKLLYIQQGTMEDEEEGIVGVLSYDIYTDGAIEDGGQWSYTSTDTLGDFIGWLDDPMLNPKSLVTFSGYPNFDELDIILRTEDTEEYKYVKRKYGLLNKKSKTNQEPPGNLDEIKSWIRKDPSKYISYNGYFLPYADISTFIWMCENGATKHQREWIDYVLTYCNFHNYASALSQGLYSEARKILMEDVGGDLRKLSKPDYTKETNAGMKIKEIRKDNFTGKTNVIAVAPDNIRMKDRPYVVGKSYDVEKGYWVGGDYHLTDKEAHEHPSIYGTKLIQENFNLRQTKLPVQKVPIKRRK